MWWQWIIPVGIAIYILRAVFSVIRQQRILKRQLAAYRRGDYEGQMAAVEGYRRKAPELSHYFYFRGEALHKLERLEEAEDALRRSLAIKTDPRLTAICRSQLGLVYLDWGKWDKAQECFRQSIAEWPDRSGPHLDMAELLLRRGMRPEDALTEAQAALDIDRGRKPARGNLGKLEYNVSLSESLAVLAWASAVNNAGAARVRQFMEESLTVCDPETKPVLARVHYFAGRAFAASSDNAEAQKHFAIAAQTDPNGNYGRLARAGVAVPA